MRNGIQRFVGLVSLTLWWGGLTFYSLVVVPIGSDVFGATAQGFVTQRVTHWLNGMSLVTLVLLLWNLTVTRRRLLIVTWLLMVSSLAGLAVLHGSLDALLDPQSQTVNDAERFYRLHRVYLVLTAVQWLAGLAHLWGLLLPDQQPAAE